MKKIRVLFPYVEAGLGHIMPLMSIKEVFEKKYGSKCEVITCNFFKDSGDPYLKQYGQFLVNQVVNYNKHRNLGYFATINSEFWGTTLSSFTTMRLIPGACASGIAYMRELNPDVVFSTHWATNYYAEHVKNKDIFTISYCPDVVMNSLFRYKANLTLVASSIGYEKAMKRRKYNEDNLKRVPFLIRNEAFNIPLDKIENRKNLNLPLDNFTITLMEGGYGIGKTEKICEELSKKHIKITIIPFCGKNEELFKKLSSLKTTEEVKLMPMAFTPNVLPYIASSDLFLGKSGNCIAEPTFFGVPSIITNFATIIERDIGNYYINNVKCALKEFDVNKIVEMIESYVKNPSLLDELSKNARDYHDNFGAEYTADLIYQEICKYFNQRDLLLEGKKKHGLRTNS